MKLEQLKNWVNTLSEDIMDYDVVCATISNEEDDNEEYTIEVDNYLNLVSIDDENKLILLLKNEKEEE